MDNLMRKLPIGIQTFEGIRKDNYLYVDKTALIWRMANLGKPYFLSRPRRFGKSLLISTFDAYFQGKKELFDGLAIEQLETKWEQHPVLHLDLNAKKYETAADLIAMLNQYLEKWEAVDGKTNTNVCISIQSERGEVKTSLFYCCFWEVRWFMVSMIPINRRIDPNRTMRYGVPLIRSSIFSASGYLMLR